ncbi:MAG: hypothetical protein PVJ80_18040 [Gemmatimonadota bacterium]|jgi:hypothetical protein
MFKSLAKGVAYTKAPVKTFALLHPKKALKWGAVLLFGRLAYELGKRRNEV